MSLIKILTNHQNQAFIIPLASHDAYKNTYIVLRVCIVSVYLFCFILTFSDLQESISKLLEDIQWQHEKLHRNRPPSLSNEKKDNQKKLFKDAIASTNDRHQHREAIVLQDICNDVITASNQRETKVVLERSFSHDTIRSSCEQSENVLCSSASVTNSSVSTLKTFDNIDFQNDLLYLDTKLDVVQHELHRKQVDIMK